MATLRTPKEGGIVMAAARRRRQPAARQVAELHAEAQLARRDLRPGMAYTLCHSLQCRACGALFLDYRFTPAQMAALYEDYRGPAYTRQRDRFEPGYAATVAQDYTRRHPYISKVEAWLAPHLRERALILDWGGGDGTNRDFGSSTLPVFSRFIKINA